MRCLSHSWFRSFVQYLIRRRHSTWAVIVKAVADAPQVSANDVFMDQDTTAPLEIFANRSLDDDDSELLSVVITLPKLGGEPIGTLSVPATIPGEISFIPDVDEGIYRIVVNEDDAEQLENLLDDFLDDDIIFTPRPGWNFTLLGEDGIMVEAISTESETGDQLAPNNSTLDGTPDDANTKIETRVTFISVTVYPPSEAPSLTPTTSQEPSSSPSALPSTTPSSSPSHVPSNSPSVSPSTSPSVSPSKAPSDIPSVSPSSAPSASPSASPSTSPSASPSKAPSDSPSASPSTSPSEEPSGQPSQSPSIYPFSQDVSCALSVIVEDVPMIIGTDITWDRISGRDEEVSQVVISGFPRSSTVWYNTTNSNESIMFDGSNGDSVTITGSSETEIRNALDTLTVAAPLNSDVDFNLTVTVTDDSDNVNNDGSCIHEVRVQAVADKPDITQTTDLELNEDDPIAMSLEISPSSDIDNTESLSLVITIPEYTADETIGTIQASNTSSITITNPEPGVYVIVADNDDVQTQASLINAWFAGGNVEFQPAEHLSGSWNNTDGIKVELISTEEAVGEQLAPDNSPSDGTGGDENTKVESDIAYIDVTINPVNDLQVMDGSIIVQENNGNSDGEPDLIVEIGKELDISTEDFKDSSETLSMKLEGFPINAKFLNFTVPIPGGVTASTNLADGTVTLSGDAEDVLDLLDSLQVILADDDDR